MIGTVIRSGEVVTRIPSGVTERVEWGLRVGHLSGFLETCVASGPGVSLCLSILPVLLAGMACTL